MRDWVHGVGHSPVCQILLQIFSRTLIMASPPDCTVSAGTLASPADSPFLSDFYAVYTSSRRMGWGSCRCRLLEGRSVLLGLLWLCSCTARSSTRTTSLFPVHVLYGGGSPLLCAGQVFDVLALLFNPVHLCPFHAFLDFLFGCPVLPYSYIVLLLLQLPPLVAQIN